MNKGCVQKCKATNINQFGELRKPGLCQRLINQSELNASRSCLGEWTSEQPRGFFWSGTVMPPTSRKHCICKVSGCSLYMRHFLSFKSDHESHEWSHIVVSQYFITAHIPIHEEHYFCFDVWAMLTSCYWHIGVWVIRLCQLRACTMHNAQCTTADTTLAPHIAATVTYALARPCLPDWVPYLSNDHRNYTSYPWLYGAFVRWDEFSGKNTSFWLDWNLTIYCCNSYLCSNMVWP